MAKVLLISDRPHWAYSAIANSIIQFNDRDGLELKHLSVKRDRNRIKRAAHRCDLSFILGWQNASSLPFLDRKKTLIGIHSHQSFDKRKTTPENDVLPPREVVDFIGSYRSVNTVSRRLQHLFRESGLEASYTPNGVDPKMFFPVCRQQPFTVGCAAAQKNDWNKGVAQFIEPTCKDLKIPLKTAMLGKGYVAHKDMPKYYKSIHCYLCASRSEGMSLSILEAASSGCVIVSTRCGDIEQLVIDGDNGFLVDRSRDAMRSKLRLLTDDPDLVTRMSESMRATVCLTWDWKFRSKAWLDFIASNL
jgi:hypothetical protein